MQAPWPRTEPAGVDVSELVCWLDPCERQAVRLVRVPVNPATADRDVEVLAERLSRTGVPMCELHAARWDGATP